MAKQPDLSQTRTEKGPSPLDEYVEGFGLQESDIRTQSAPGGFLGSLDTSFSYLQSSTGYSTSPTHLSDVVSGSDKRGTFGDHSPSETGDGTTSNSLHDGMLSTSFSGRQVQSIDPRLLLYDQGLGEQTGVLPLFQNASISAAVNANFDTASCQPTSQMIYPNEFDMALEETETALGVEKSELGPLSYLMLWMLLNPGLLPSTKELKCLEHLAHIPSNRIMTWLRKHISVISKRHTDTLQEPGVREYCPKCLNSRQRKTLSGEPRLYECTYRCGQTFSRHRKGDWERHERINFEEWVCSVCDDVLSRKDHLRKHLKAVHNKECTKLESQKRQLLDSMDRPCGFCFKVFPTWVAWLAHVAAHFEGSIGGRKRKTSEWKERMIIAPSSGASPRTLESHEGVTGYDADNHIGGNGDGGDGNNSRSNALSSSYQPTHIEGGFDQGDIARYGLGFLQATFNGYSRDTTPQTSAHVLGAPSLPHTDGAEVALGDTHEIVHRFAALGLSTITDRSASDAYSQASWSADYPTNANMEPHVWSHPRSDSGSAVTRAHHQKRSIDRNPTKLFQTDSDEVRFPSMMPRWLGEKPHQEHWNPVSRTRGARITHLPLQQAVFAAIEPWLTDSYPKL